MESKVSIPITDIAMITLSGLTENYGKRLRTAMEDADLIVVSHPYLYPEMKKHNIKNIPFVYEAHNLESKMKKQMLPKGGYSDKLVEQVFDVEKECCEKSVFVMTCSEEDRQAIHEIYGTSLDKIIVVPNGVDCSATSFVSVEDRIENKKQLGLEDEKIGLFMGSWHQPNLEACEYIFEIARKTPDIKYLLMGSQCLYYSNNKIPVPANVGLLGLVSEEEKNRVFASVDFALNPMMSGSGTNLKMFDYMSAGIPIITTEFGTRGIEDKTLFILSEVDDMSEATSQFLLDEQETRIICARKCVEDVFDWSVIVKTLERRIIQSM